jgi:hypothetical protein
MDGIRPEPREALIFISDRPATDQLRRHSFLGLKMRGAAPQLRPSELPPNRGVSPAGRQIRHNFMDFRAPD